MSAPFAGSSNGSPVPGYYPDPSIPGYIRYWNGSSWVPGTSRPAPGPGEPPPAPPGESGGQVPAVRGSEPVPPQEEDAEDDSDEIDLGRASGGSSLPEVRPRGEVAAPGAADEYADWDDPRRLHGDQPQAASAWHADPAQQTGFGDDAQPDLSWGTPESGPPGGYRDPAESADPRSGWHAQHDDAAYGTGSGAGPDSGAAGQNVPDHTVGIRMPRPQAPQEGGTQGAPQPEHTVGLRRSDAFSYGASDASGAGAQAPPQQGPQQYEQPLQQPPGQHAHQHQQYGGQPVQDHPGGPAQDLSAGQGVPGQGGQRPPWEQQVHDLAQQAPGHGQGVPHQQTGGPGAPGAGPGFGGHATSGPGLDGAAPWRPPTADPFADAAREARPAGLGKRLGARFVDGLIAYAVAAAVAFPFVGKAADHVQEKIDAVNQAGVTRTIWLVDGTTGVYLAIVVGVFLLFGLLYEALPTAKWGGTPGKKLFGLRVLDIERQDSPGFGAALRRWLTYSVLSLVVLGVVNVMWCLFDRPWRQCWHDKLARTFVADR